MFRRREKPSFWYHVREFFWPSMGFVRSTRYVAHRVGRMPGTPGSIALGFATGAGVACTPFVGFHLGIAMVLSWVIRGSPLAAAIATQVVGNLWTIPFILGLSYKLGARLLGKSSLLHLPGEVHLTNLGYVFHHPGQVLLPMLLGSTPIALAVGVISFFPARFLVSRYHLRRKTKRRRGETA
jgi:uncharacterized protein